MFRGIILLWLTVVCCGYADTGNPKVDEQKEETGPRIVGGANADITDYPYQVSVEANRYHFCGGSIIKEYWVVSAGHCVNYSKAYAVRAGSSVVLAGGTVHPVSKLFPHVNYTGQQTRDYDLSLIQVRTPFVFGVGVAPIKLPIQGEGEVYIGLTATVTGWGMINPENEEYPDQLQVVHVPVMSMGECSDWHTTGAPITDRMICTSGFEKGACMGDSGGPMVVNDQLIGIVSWGDGQCSKHGAPTVYAKVSAASDWIDSNSVGLPSSSSTPSGVFSCIVALLSLLHLYLNK